MKRYNVSFVASNFVHIVTVDASGEDQATAEAEAQVPDELLARVHHTYCRQTIRSITNG